MKTLKELLTCFLESDSISERNTAKEQIAEKCANFITTKDKIAERFGFSAINDSDYCNDRGWWYLMSSDISDSGARLVYTDHWGYGGSCSIPYIFKPEEVDNFTEDDIVRYYQLKRLDTLTRDITLAEQQLTNAKNKLEKFRDEIQQSVKNTNHE